MSVFETLNAVDVSQHIEKKGNFDYVSWAWAWQYVKRIYPNATYSVTMNALPNGYCVNYFTDGNTAFVETTVTIEDVTLTEQLPITDYKNKSIKLDAITSFDVNTAVKRCLTKCLALHGLGLSLWAGEDLPQENKQQNKQQTVPKARDKRLNEIEQLAQETGTSISKLEAYYKVKLIDALTETQIEHCLDKLRKKAVEQLGAN